VTLGSMVHATYLVMIYFIFHILLFVVILFNLQRVTSFSLISGKLFNTHQDI
jgi:uncharacterized integral membrane protein